MPDSIFRPAFYLCLIFSRPYLIIVSEAQSVWALRPVERYDFMRNSEEENSRKEKAEESKKEILKIAYGLFQKYGYTKTSMRQIAADAGVSHGLITYYFKNKREVAIELVKGKMDQFAEAVHRYVDWENEPALYSAVLERLSYTVFSTPIFFEFYKDVLREYIMFEVLADSGIETDLRIWKKYCPELSEEDAIRTATYGNYVSACMESAMVLYGKEKLYLKESIPDSVFRVSIGMWHFPDEQKIIEECCRRSREIVEHILWENPELYK